MKKLFFAFATLLCCGLAACSDDDANVQEEPANALIGTWKHVIDDREPEDSILLTFKNNGACIFQEITYYNNQKPAIGHMNYVYDEQTQKLHLTLISFEDPDMVINEWSSSHEPGSQEEWDVIVGAEGQILIKTYYRSYEWMTFTKL